MALVRYWARDVFTDSEVGDYFNEHFISLKVDCEKGEGPRLRERFGVAGFPTLLFLNGEGEVVSKMVGASKQPVFLQKVKEGLDPNTSVYGKEKQYKAGKRDRAFVLDLITSYRNQREYKKSREVSLELLATLSEKELADRRDVGSGSGLFCVRLWFGMVEFYPETQ